MKNNNNMVGSPHAHKPPARSSHYREQLKVFVRQFVRQIDQLDPKGDHKTLIALHGVAENLWPILDHEFPRGFGLGQAIEEWLDLKLDLENQQMADHQRRIVVEDLEKFLEYTPEQFHRDLDKK